jgi:glycolate oxidase FAD binding subunit
MSSPITLKPASAADLIDAIADAARHGTRLAIAGGGSKAAIGAPAPDATPLDMTGFAGVIDYDPAELVLTVGAGTPLAEIQALVAGAGQMLAFEPFDHGPIFGRAAGMATIGGIVAAGVAGSRRLSAGGVRDHLLGFRAVSGRGEAFVAGAKVVKNVTGYDLPKLACGSWGRLFALTELTLKTLPAARACATRAIAGLDPQQAQKVMALAMGSQADVSAAAHIPAHVRSEGALTAIRIAGFGPSVVARCAMLDRLLAEHGPVLPLSDSEADAFWSGLRTLAPLGGSAPLWRINVPPSAGPQIVASLPADAGWMFDWAGGLIWVAFEGPPFMLRTAAEAAGGHAALVRAPADMRARISALHPQPKGVAALEARVRRAFDPQSIFETGRFRDAH